MKLTKKQVNQMFSEGGLEEDGLNLRVVEEGEFEQDYKYQSAEVIFTDGEKFYSATVTRSGSPFTDWYYEDYGYADITEVEKREVTITKWVAK